MGFGVLEVAVTSYLNFYQRAAVSLTLRSFEESLRYSQSWLASWRVNTQNDPRRSLPPEHCQAALATIAAAREEIASLRQRLDLISLEDNPCARIRAEMTFARNRLWEIRTQHLARFGRPASGLADTLDPSVTRLSGLADQLAAIFAERPADYADVQNQAGSGIEP